MTGRELIKLHEIMQEAFDHYEKDREWYADKLEVMAPDADDVEAKRYKRMIHEADEKARVCAGVLNTIEMRQVDINL